VACPLLSLDAQLSVHKGNNRNIMIIVWRGLGLPIVLAGCLVAGITGAAFDKVYMATHALPKVLALGAGAVAVFMLGHWRENQTGMRDSVYWIPVKFWAVLMLIIGIGWAFSPDPSTPVAARSTPEPDSAPTRIPSKAATANGLRLQGIFASVPGQGSAIINGKTVFAGDKVGDYTVRTVESQMVILDAADGTKTVLRLPNRGQ
jgi:hypothetical protein